MFSYQSFICRLIAWLWFLNPYQLAHNFCFGCDGIMFVSSTGWSIIHLCIQGFLKCLLNSFSSVMFFWAGDKYLKPVVIAEPEITFTKREPEDECLILASDGLWDVLSSDLACQVARECLREKNPPAKAGPQIEEEGAGALYPSRSMLAAALLTRLALGRRSADNISVIVVDLKRSWG
jgi:serine/threonine protein phosphatase PrpC